MRITTKGQVTIPLEIREKAGLFPLTEVSFELEGDRVILRKAEGRGSRGKAMVERMRGRATAGMSTDQILALTRK